MLSSYQPTKAYPDLMCGICWNPLEEDIVAHAPVDDTKGHPVHRDCAREWVRASSSSACPVCRIQIDMPLFLVECLMQDLKECKKNDYGVVTIVTTCVLSLSAAAGLVVYDYTNNGYVLAFTCFAAIATIVAACIGVGLMSRQHHRKKVFED